MIAAWPFLVPTPLEGFIAEAYRAPELPIEPLTWVLRHPELQRGGLWLEFGVYSGSTLRQMVAADHWARVIGFDSFKGLPRLWREGFPAGTFSMDGAVPSVQGAEIVPGLFEETLPTFRPDDLATLVHVDCDLYESTRTVLQHVVPMLAEGALVVFDEALDYVGFESHEILALYEAREAGFEFDWIGRRGEKLIIRSRLGRAALASPSHRTATRCNAIQGPHTGQGEPMSTTYFPGGPGHEPVEPPPLDPEVLPALTSIIAAVTSDDETDYYQAMALTLNLWDKRKSYDASKADAGQQRLRRIFEVDLRGQLVRMRDAIVTAMRKPGFYVRAEGIRQATPLDSINNPRNVRMISSWDGHGEHTSYPREGTPLGLIVCLRTHIESCAAM